MKKNHFQYIPLLACFLILFQYSCNKLVDLKPINEISDANFWTTPDQFRLAANEFYTYLRTFTDVINDAPHADRRADFQYIGSAPNSFSSGTNSIPQTDGNWNSAYARLRAINYLLSKAAGYKTPQERNILKMIFFHTT